MGIETGVSIYAKWSNILYYFKDSYAIIFNYAYKCMGVQSDQR